MHLFLKEKEITDRVRYGKDGTHHGHENFQVRRDG